MAFDTFAGTALAFARVFQREGGIESQASLAMAKGARSVAGLITFGGNVVARREAVD